MLFKKVVLSLRLQKSDLKRIFYYTYKYKITIYIGGLLLYQNTDLKIAIATSLYSMKTSL